MTQQRPNHLMLLHVHKDKTNNIDLKEISLCLFSPTYSTTMLIDKSGAFTALEADISQTGGNIQILHLKLDYFRLCAFCKKYFPGILISLKRVK